MRRPRSVAALILAAFSAAWSASSSEVRLQRHSFSSFRMGTRFELVLYAPSAQAAGRASRKALDRIAELETALSDYRADSELRRLEESAFDGAVPVSGDLLSVLESALGFARLTGGAFDPTVGALTRLWRESARTGIAPTSREIERARRPGGHRSVRVDPVAGTVRFLAPGIRLDLGGIAKGFAADRALAVLAEEGIESALIDAGGDIVVSRPPPGKTGWTVELEGLSESDPRLRLSLQNGAVATSGTTRRFVTLDGVRRSHLQDPASGHALSGPSVTTVLARDGATADALATAFSVMPSEEALAMADRLPGVCARLLRVEGGRETVRLSACFPGAAGAAPPF